MGGNVGKLQSDLRFVVAGLSSSGKSSLLKNGPGKPEVTENTDGGTAVEVMTSKGLGCRMTITTWACGCTGAQNPDVLAHAKQADALVFVVDSGDRERIAEAADQLKHVLLSDGLQGVPLLVCANKQDAPGALTTLELTEQLRSDAFAGRRWRMQATCGLTGDGLFDGLEWLAEEVGERRKEERAKVDSEEDNPQGGGRRPAKGKPRIRFGRLRRRRREAPQGASSDEASSAAEDSGASAAEDAWPSASKDAGAASTEDEGDLPGAMPPSAWREAVPDSAWRWADVAGEPGESKISL